MRLPDFIYVGTGKAGTTWLLQALNAHPGIYVTPVKETNFFDLNHDKGLGWYASFFSDAPEGSIVGEISHRYLRDPRVVERIAQDLGTVRIVVGLREPVDYCLSDYLFTKRSGQFDGDFAAWHREGRSHGALRYRDMIEPFVARFGVENIHVYRFDDLARRPQAMFDDLVRFLGAAPYTLPEEVLKPVNVASKARIGWLSRLASRASKWLKRHGGQRLISAVKYNPLVQALLYSKLRDKPEVDGRLRAEIRALAAPHVAWLDETFDRGFSSWLEERA